VILLTRLRRTTRPDRADDRIEHEPHKERGQQAQGQGDWQVLHEVTHNARPEHQRQERAHGGERGCGDRPGDLARSEYRCLNAAVTELDVAVDVLHDDDGIVYQHTQNQHQAE